MDLDVAHTEADRAEGQIDAFINHMDTKRRDTEGERLEEELYAESTRRYNEQRQEEARAEWAEYHASQAERLRRTMEPLIAFHEARAAMLAGVPQDGGGRGPSAA